MPYAITVETSSICNLACPECLVGTKKTQRTNIFFDIKEYENLLKNLKKNSFYLNLYFQGEPFLNQNIIEFIRIANKYKYYTVIATNGHCLNETIIKDIINNKLSKIIFSVDGISQQIYCTYRRNGNINKLIDNILLLKKIKEQYKSKLPIVEVQFLVHKYNENEFKKVKKWALENNFIFKIKTIQIYNNYHLIPTKNKFSRYYIGRNNTIKIKKRNTLCWRVFSNIIVNSDNNVVLCCQDKIPEYSYGNIKQNSIKEIWNSKIALQYRKSVLEKKIYLCDNCGV
ncbi:MAG: SPASM domain-containing protein [Bacteroidales bacterium]|nr:SPASM domain-containing protein [Bacteroidales bacterium]